MLGNVIFVNPEPGEPPTGEPYAGDPPVRFGGGRGRIQSALPTPIKSLETGRPRPVSGNRGRTERQRFIVRS